MISSKLYKLSARGKINTWWVEAKGLADGTAEIISYSGYVDGKIKESHTIVKKGKGIGTIRETTPLEQAKLEAQSKWNRKKDRNGMTEDIPGQNQTSAQDQETVVWRPMLAKDYKKSKNSEKIVKPCFGQRKYDGIRHIIRSGDNMVCYSRTGNVRSYPHLEKEVKKLLGNKEIYLDGELYTHGIDFSIIQGSTSRDKSEKDIEKINYHIYDCFDVTNPGWKYIDRKSFLESLKFDKVKSLKLVPTVVINDESDMLKYFKEFTDEKYEGLILRNSNGLYKKNYRSFDLQKYKSFDDAEFKILDAKEGKGNHKGCAVFQCETNGKSFWCVIDGDLEKRQRLFQNKDNLIGKMLTVQYQGLSSKEIPRFPVGKRIRNYD